jgi:O-acetyl-ADP-ribose deacetylase (regulator of RNase III)
VLVYLESDLFDSPAQTLVNTVNTVGVMGKGIAKTFKQRYPRMFEEYKRLCDAGSLGVGSLMLWRGADRWVLNFPTKTTWKLPSKLEYVEAGLARFAATYDELGITSISFPPLGCGNGQLDWRTVKPVMERHLEELPLPVYVHVRHVKTDFVPEHLETKAPVAAASGYEQFLQDLRELTADTGADFATLDRSSRFSARFADDGNLTVERSEGDEVIPAEAIEDAWLALQAGLVTVEAAGAPPASGRERYLFSLLAELPYVQVARFERRRNGAYQAGHGLFLRETSTAAEVTAERSPTQTRLWR